MAWWWTKTEKKEEEEKRVEEGVITSDPKEKEETPEDPSLSPEFILAKYSIIPDTHETNLTGESIGKDLLSSAINYAKSYFKWKEDISDLDELKKNIDRKYSRITRLGLDNCQSGKELRDLRNEINNKIKYNNNYKSRKTFVEELYNDIDNFTPVLISYKDFDTIREKYGYNIDLLKKYDGFLSDKNIDGLEEILRFDSSVRDEGRNRVINILRRYYRNVSLYTDLPDAESGLKEGDSPFCLIVEKKNSSWKDQQHPKILCVLNCDREQVGYYSYASSGHTVYEGINKESSKELIEDKIKELPIERAFKEYKVDKPQPGNCQATMLSALWEQADQYVLAYNTILALYPEDKNKPVLVFQFYTDGVIVYGSLGKEDIFESISDEVSEKLTEKFYYQ